MKALRRALVVVLLLLASVTRAGAAIAFDNSTGQGGNGVSVTSLSWTHTLNSAGAIVVAVYINGDNLSSVTVDGVAMTLIAASKQNATPVGTAYIQLAIGTGYASGARAIVVNASASSTIYGNSVGYTGVASAGQPESTITGGGLSTGLTISLSSITSTDWAVCWANDNTAANVAASGMTNRITNSAYGGLRLLDSAGTTGTSFSTTIDNSAANHNYNGTMIALLVSGGAATKSLLTLGVGDAVRQAMSLGHWEYFWDSATWALPMGHTVRQAGVDVFQSPAAGVDVFGGFSAGVDVFDASSAGLDVFVTDLPAGIDDVR